MKLPMPDEEIAMRYRNAIDPKKSIKILAQLNATTQQEIIAALGRQGIIVTQPPRATHHRAKMNQKEAQRLYDIGLNDCQISKEMSVAYSTIYAWRTRNNLPPRAERGNPLVQKKRAKSKIHRNRSKTI